MGSCRWLSDMFGQDWVGPFPCSALIPSDFLSAQIRAVLLPVSHLTINGDCSKHRGGVRRPRNIPYSSSQVINKHWSPIKKDTERRIHVNTCHSGKCNWAMNTWMLQKWEMGHFSMSDNIQGLSKRQSKAEHMYKWVRIWSAPMKREVACFFLFFFLKAFWKLLPNTHNKMESLWLILRNTGEKIIFLLWTSDNIEY